MDENINNNQENNENNEINENNIVSEEKTLNNNQHLWKFVLFIFAVFLGTFAVVYTIVDKAMYGLGFKPFFVMSKQIEKIFDENEKYLENDSLMPVKIENKNDKYTVTINLKNFDNNTANIDIQTDNNGIKIKGEYNKNSKGEIKESSFYQNVIFPNKINTEKIKKETKGNKLIIDIPFEEQN